MNNIDTQTRHSECSCVAFQKHLVISERVLLAPVGTEGGGAVSASVTPLRGGGHPGCAGTFVFLLVLLVLGALETRQRSVHQDSAGPEPPLNGPTHVHQGHSHRRGSHRTTYIHI